MPFDRRKLPGTSSYFEAEGLTLKGPGKWKTAACHFHDGSDSMRVHADSGAWVCMSCGEKGGDVLSHHMKRHGLEFVAACRALGAWVEDGNPAPQQKATPLPARAALQVLAFEVTLTAVATGNVARDVNLTDQDRFRLLRAANRINRIAEAFK